MSAYVELGDLGERAAGRGSGLAVLLPGFAPLFAMPLLLSAGGLAIEHGWRARLVDWDPPEDRDPAWVAGELASAVGDHSGDVLVVAKSLGTLASPYVADHGWDAVWLDPLLHRPKVAEAITRHPGRQLLIGGTADPVWRAEVAAGSGADVLEVPGADHGLVMAGDALGSAEAHVTVIRRIKEWLRSPGMLSG